MPVRIVIFTSPEVPYRIVRSKFSIKGDKVHQERRCMYTDAGHLYQCFVLPIRTSV